jgi:hypothetical protein
MLRVCSNGGVRERGGGEMRGSSPSSSVGLADRLVIFPRLRAWFSDRGGGGKLAPRWVEFELYCIVVNG